MSSVRNVVASSAAPPAGIPLGIAGPDHPGATFTVDRPIDALWRPSLAPWRHLRVSFRGGPGDTFAVPEGLELAFAHDFAERLPGFRWVTPPKRADLLRQHGEANGHMPGGLPPVHSMKHAKEALNA